MSFRSRRNLALRPVHSIKHVIDVASAVVNELITNIQVIQAVDAPTLANTQQVETGSTVNAVYLRVEVLGTVPYVTIPRTYMAVFKNPGGNLSVPNPSRMGSDDDKKWVIHQEMTMLGNVGASPFPRTMFQGVIRIPPKLKRFGINDTLIILFANEAGTTTGTANVCVQCIYKEFR